MAQMKSFPEVPNWVVQATSCASVLAGRTSMDAAIRAASMETAETI